MTVQGTAIIRQANPQACFHLGGRTLAEVQPDSSLGAQVSAFIRNRFVQCYGARPEVNVQTLLTLSRLPHHLAAAVGVRNAGLETLFLEHYLDAPIEQHVPATLGCGRAAIAEIAHLAGVEPGVSRFLFPLMTVWLQERGYAWIAFTGTAQLRNSFERMGIPTRKVASADPRRLPDGGLGWGSYYANQPEVMIAHVASGHEALQRAGITRRIRHLERHGGAYELTA